MDEDSICSDRLTRDRLTRDRTVRVCLISKHYLLDISKMADYTHFMRVGEEIM